MLLALESNFLVPNATFLVMLVLVLLVIVIPIVALVWLALGRRAKSRADQTAGRSPR
jgi:hypothetical protein